MEKVRIDYEKLCKEIEKKGKSKQQFSVECGRDASFISGINKKREVGKNIENLICVMLGIEPGSLVETPEETVHTQVKILERMHSMLQDIKEMLETQNEEMQKISRKANANTLQMEKIKEMVAEPKLSESYKAEKIIRDLIGNRFATVEDIYAEADREKVSRKEMLHAKTRLGVRATTIGYGNKKVIWRFEECEK